MTKNLWELRQRKKMTVKQLASRSGVKAGNIYAYESGDPIRMADLEKLAKALYVNSNDIKIQSDPVPSQKKKTAPVPSAAAPKTKTPQTAEKPAPSKQAKQSPPATEGQIKHLLDLAKKLGHVEADVSQRIGKPLNELTSPEAKTWLLTYTKECQSLRPDDTRVKRTYLPESVDTFELNYLTQQQAAKTIMAFTLLDKTQFNGFIVGFSPYAITIEQADGTQVTMQKLALAYYMTAETDS